MTNIFQRTDEYVKKALDTTIGQLIFKYVFRPKGFNSLVLIFGLFLYRELQSLFYGEKISDFCKTGIEESSSIYEKYVYKAIEFFFVNGSWITIVILSVILIALFWIRHLELKYSKKQFKPTLAWAEDRLSLALTDIGRRYITFNNDEYKDLHIHTYTEKLFLYFNAQTLYDEYNNLIKGRYPNSYFYDEVSTADMAPSYEEARDRCAAYLGEEYYAEYFSAKKDDVKIETFEDSKELLKTKELTHQLLNELKIDNYKSVSNLVDELIVLLKLLVNEMNLRIHFVEASDMRHESDTYDVDRMLIADAVSEVERVLYFLSSEKVKIYTKRTLLLVGEALTGKTHLLCNLAETRLKSKKPTLICFGHKFNNHDTPLYQMSKQLDIQNYNLSEEEFLVLLNEWGKVENDFVLLIFDGINETENKSIWHNNLKSLVEKIESYPYIRIALSVRDVEKYQVIQQSDKQFLVKRIAQIEHLGFEGIEIEVLKKFCFIFNIDLPTFPLVNPIFANPGLLFLFFETLKRKDVRTINENILRPNFIIEEFIQDVNTRFIERFHTIQRRQYVIQTTHIASKKIVDNNYIESIYYDDVVNLTANIHEAILDYLISEGIFITNFTQFHEQILNFSYQKFGNYFIALYLLADYSRGGYTPDKIKELLQNDTKIIDLTTNIHKYPAIIEALTTRLSESFELDILEIFPDLKKNNEMMKLRLSGLINAETIPGNISSYFSNINLIDNADRDYYLTLLLTHSWKVNSPFNIESVLHKLLLHEQISTRDSWWSIFLHHNYISNGITKRIIKWAWNKTYDYVLEEKSLFLYGLTLSWFLVSSNRELRDSSTKAIVNLFTNNLQSFLYILKEFETIDDLYILERLYAAAYGIVLRSENTDGFKELGEYIYTAIFDVDYVIENILVRDYAKSCIQTINKKVDLEINIEKTKPPYNQNRPWKLPEISKKDIAQYREEYPMMYGSALSGDFKIYVLYHYMKHWSSRFSKEKLFDIKNAKRWLLKEAISYGWTKELFYDFDRSISTGRMHNNKSERIGKKYQWLALYKLLAKMADNYKISLDKGMLDEEESRFYSGAYEIGIRDLDPTSILRHKIKSDEKWWFTLDNKFENNILSDIEWMNSKEMLPELSNLVNISKNTNECLLLSTGFSIDGNKEKETYRNLYYNVTSFIVKKEKFNELKEWVSKQFFYARWMPSHSNHSEIFLREFPYSEAFDFVNTPYYGSSTWTDEIEQENGKIPAEVLLTSTAYFNEAQGYDYSVDESIEINLPNKWLIDEMGLTQTLNDGEWVNAKNEIVFFDPTISSCCISPYNETGVLIASKKVLLNFLDKNGYEIFWVMWGEKQVRDHEKSYSRDSLGISEISGYGYFEKDNFIESNEVRYED